jgi:hypothetical protein
LFGNRLVGAGLRIARHGFEISPLWLPALPRP